ILVGNFSRTRSTAPHARRNARQTGEVTMVVDFRKSKPPQQGWAAFPLVVAVLEEQRAAAPQVAPRAGGDLAQAREPVIATDQRNRRLEPQVAEVGIARRHVRR